MMGNISSFINEQSSHNVQQLVQWKDTRAKPLIQEITPPSVEEIIEQSDNVELDAQSASSVNSDSKHSHDSV